MRQILVVSLLVWIGARALPVGYLLVVCNKWPAGAIWPLTNQTELDRIAHDDLGGFHFDYKASADLVTVHVRIASLWHT